MSNQSLELTEFRLVKDAFKQGKVIIIVDDSERENEGDLCIASDFISLEAINFMSTYGRGLICFSISEAIAQRLKFPYQVENNASPFQTPFAVSVDHYSVVDDNHTALAKVKTIKEVISPYSKPNDFVSPGANFPLIANPAGVLGRNGQTEGGFDMARICGLTHSAVICEILDQDGSMLRGKALQEFAIKHNLPITSVADIAKARLKGEVIIRPVAQTKLLSNNKEWKVIIYQDDATDKEHIAMIFGNIDSSKTCLTRIHSECLTGDVFGSLRCDCGDQLEYAKSKIEQNGSGLIIYLRQEGRGIGLTNKLKAYWLQENKGLDTVDANLELGFPADLRNFKVAVNILKDLKLNNLSLLTNNPDKLNSLEEHGILVQERIPVVVPSNAIAKNYLETKKTKLGHLF